MGLAAPGATLIVIIFIVITVVVLAFIPLMISK